MTLRFVSIAAFTASVVGLVLLVFTGAILASGPVGVSIQLLAAVLMIWARVTFGRRSFHAASNPTEGGLVTTGPYRYIRHPNYAAGTKRIIPFVV